MEKLTEKEIKEFAFHYIKKVKNKEEIINANAFYVVMWSEKARVRFGELPDSDHIYTDEEASLSFRSDYDTDPPHYMAIVVFDHLNQSLVVKAVVANK